MNWIVSKKKYDFIGKRALSRSDTIKENRKQLVGILTKDPNEILEEGVQLVEKETTLTYDYGWTCYFKLLFSKS